MIGLTLLFVIPLILRRQKLVIKREAASNVMSGHISDIYSNIDAVRAFASEDNELKTHKKYVDDLMQKSKHSWDYQNRRIDIVTSPMYVLTNVIGLLLALQLGKDNPNNIAAIFVTFSYYAGFTRIMWEFNRIYRDIESALSEAGEFTELLDNSIPTITDPDHPIVHDSKEGNVNFKQVTFSYQEDGSQALFENFNLKFETGEKVGLVGHSGGGKSTITKLLLRFVDVDEGQIEINGVNISKLTQKNLRQFISYVPQEPAMFHRSIKDNISYGKPGADIKEVKNAADKAHASEFIEKLPAKYETLIGERGIKLSGGQRQRVAIARAMLKDAPILVLDEATSALDSESEKLIQDALWKLMEGKTAIVIAHRLSTIQKMDRIIVLHEGEISEQGSHKDLLEKDGIYAKLWAHQSGGFLED
jgi:ATP-binding cassette subfamily B protein